MFCVISGYGAGTGTGVFKGYGVKPNGNKIFKSKTTIWSCNLFDLGILKLPYSLTFFWKGHGVRNGFGLWGNGGKLNKF